LSRKSEVLCRFPVFYHNSVNIRHLKEKKNFKSSILKEYSPVCSTNGADIAHILKLRTKTMLKSLLEGIKVKHPHGNEGLDIFIGYHTNKRKSAEARETNTTQAAI
jgi:hypothetical protein